MHTGRGDILYTIDDEDEESAGGGGGEGINSRCIFYYNIYNMRGAVLAELLLLGIAVGFQRGPHHPRAAVSGEPRIESQHREHQHPKPMGDTKFTQDKPILHDKRSVTSIKYIIYQLQYNIILHNMIDIIMYIIYI